MARVHLNTQGNRVLTAQGCLLKVILPARLKAFPLDVRLQVSFLPAQIGPNLPHAGCSPLHGPEHGHGDAERYGMVTSARSEVVPFPVMLPYS